ncbi:MAG TPA: ADP-ribosylglycohydrolase family protein, partial [Pseudomonadota bacterium]|nr:ADP-ribosylglycohydrolase family protein [Pseudomonadota bacterium]
MSSALFQRVTRNVLPSLHPTKEQWVGCLIGQCIGDAVGAPVEGLLPKDCKRHAEKVLRQGLLDDPF